VINAVLDALNKTKPTSYKVMIQSTHSSVLKIFDKSKFERVYKVDENIGDAAVSAIKDIKTFADSVVIGKKSVFPETSAFLVNSTNIVAKLKSFKLRVYVETFSNEFVSQAWDYYSDASIEINSFVIGTKVNGIITDFPKTANRYRSKFNLLCQHLLLEQGFWKIDSTWSFLCVGTNKLESSKSTWSMKTFFLFAQIISKLSP